MGKYELKYNITEESRAVSKAFLDGNRYLDTAKELIYTEYSMPYLSNAIHDLAHTCLVRLDIFGDILHERHLMQYYPATGELDISAEITSIDDCFDLVINVLTNIQEALTVFCDKANGVDIALKLKAEQLITYNSEEFTRFLLAQQRYGFTKDDSDLTDFDLWCKETL